MFIPPGIEYEFYWIKKGWFLHFVTLRVRALATLSAEMEHDWVAVRDKLGKGRCVCHIINKLDPSRVNLLGNGPFDKTLVEETTPLSRSICQLSKT
jgi:hypothetical protein